MNTILCITLLLCATAFAKFNFVSQDIVYTRINFKDMSDESIESQFDREGGLYLTEAAMTVPVIVIYKNGSGLAAVDRHGNLANGGEKYESFVQFSVKIGTLEYVRRAFESGLVKNATDDANKDRTCAFSEGKMFCNIVSNHRFFTDIERMILEKHSGFLAYQPKYTDAIITIWEDGSSNNIIDTKPVPDPSLEISGLDNDANSITSKSVKPQAALVVYVNNRNVNLYQGIAYTYALYYPELSIYSVMDYHNATDRGESFAFLFIVIGIITSTLIIVTCVICAIRKRNLKSADQTGYHYANNTQNDDIQLSSIHAPYMETNTPTPIPGSLIQTTEGPVIVPNDAIFYTQTPQGLVETNRFV